MKETNIKAEGEPMSSYFLITSADKGKVFEIKKDGTVWYNCKGEFRVADTDKKLGIAMGRALLTLVAINKKI
jgi:hypothetical protein